MANGNLIDKAYAPAHDYHTTIPEGPLSLMVPPSALGDQRSDAFNLTPPAEHEFDAGEFISPGFFKQVNPSWFSHHPIASPWSYAMRREAQQILPFLYLGPSAASKDRDFLCKEGITLLLSVRDTRSALSRLVSGDRIAAELGIESDSIDVDGDSDLITKLPHGIRRINQHVLCGASVQPGVLPPRVLVFCEGGNDKSAGLVMAYLMAMYNLDMPTAMWTVQHRRFCVSVNAPVQTLLSSFGTILDAKRHVTRARQAETANQNNVAQLCPNSITKKRSFVDLNDDAPSGFGSNGRVAAEALSDSEHVKQKPAPFVDIIN